AFAFGCRIVVLDGTEEAGDQAFVREPMQESVHPAVDFRLRRRATEEGLVVGTDAIAFALGARGKSVGDLLGRHAVVQGLHPAIYLGLARRAAEDVLVHALDPARAGAAVIGDVLRGTDEAGFESLVGQAVLHGFDPAVETIRIGRPSQV